jgi:hypothetical protein
MEGDSRWLLGLDLGQAEDFSALGVVEQVYRAGRWAYEVRHLHRWELTTSYVKVVDDVAALIDRPPLRGCLLLPDATGCGRPVVDMLRQRHPPCQLVPVLITGGAQSSFEAGFWHVAKRELVAVLNILLGQDRLRIAQALALARTLEAEFANFRAKVTPTGHEVLEAPWREGSHDDILLAVVLALWYGERRPPAVDPGGAVVLVPGRQDGPAEGFPESPPLLYPRSNNRTGPVDPDDLPPRRIFNRGW